MAVCVFVRRGRLSARRSLRRFLSSSSPPPPPPAPVWDWLVTLLNNSNWLASAVGGSQTANHCGSPRRALPFFFFFFHHVGSEGSYCLLKEVFKSATYSLKKTKQSKKEYMLLCRSNSCLLFSLSVKNGKEALNSFHNPSTPFFFLLASNSVRSHLCLWTSSQGTAVWWDLCSSTTQCLRYSCTQACGCILTYIGEHIKVIHAVLQACRGEITWSDRLFPTARTVAKMSQMNSKPDFWYLQGLWIVFDASSIKVRPNFPFKTQM